MKKIKYFLALLIFSGLFLGCESKAKWNKTREGYYYWGTEEDDVDLSWSGSEVGGLVHNDGKMTKYNSSGDKLESKKIKANYGIIDAKEYLSIPNGGVYLGEQTKNHIPQGFGVYRNLDTIIIGTFDKGAPNGKEISILLKDTILYRGEMKKGLYNGDGRLYDKGKLIYEGGFKSGEYDGEGTLYAKGSVKYTGGWKDGLYQGKGVLYDDGKVLQGDWSAGKLEKGSLESFINESGRVWNYITRNDEKNVIKELPRDNSYDSPQLFVDSLTCQLNNYIEQKVKENVENRFGFWDMFRIFYQGGGFIFQPYGAGERMKFFFNSTNKGLSQNELQDWVNTKISHYNDVTYAQPVNPVVFSKENIDVIITPELEQLVKDREAMEITSLWIGVGVDFLLSLIIWIIFSAKGCLIDIIIFIISFPLVYWIIDSRTFEIEQQITSLLIENYMNYINMQDLTQILLL